MLGITCFLLLHFSHLFSLVYPLVKSESFLVPLCSSSQVIPIVSFRLLPHFFHARPFLFQFPAEAHNLSLTLCQR